MSFKEDHLAKISHLDDVAKSEWIRLLSMETKEKFKESVYAANKKE